VVLQDASQSQKDGIKLRCHIVLSFAQTIWLRKEIKWVFDLGWSVRVIGVCRPIRNLKGVCSASFIINERNQTPMNTIVHYIGLDVHKETIAVAIAPQHSAEVRRYGIIGGTLEAIDKLIKRIAQQNVELRLVYEAGPCGFVICRHLRSKGIHCDVVAPSLIPKKLLIG
jgi:hypothetical protein